MKILFPAKADLDPRSVWFRNKEGIWIDAYGHETPVHLLTDKHLINIKKVLQFRARRLLYRNRAFYSSCPEPNGEMAQDAFLSESMFWLDVEDSTAVSIILGSFPFWEHLMLEFHKRGLSLELEEDHV